MKTWIRNGLVAGAAGVALVSAAVAFGGVTGHGAMGHGGPGMRAMGFGPGAMGAMGHGPGGMGTAMSHGPRADGFGHGEPAEMARQQLDALAKTLQLQPAQQAAWTQFAGAVASQAKRMGELRESVGDAPRTAPERFDQASRFAKERERAADEVGKAMKSLYEVLTPEQRKLLDRPAPGRHHG